MEVRPGYKQTEVGTLPEDWEISTVGREFSVQLGKMLDAERNVGVAKPYLGNKAVQWSRIDIGSLPTVPMSPTDMAKFRLEHGDLLVCEGGEVGRAAIWDAPIEECYYQKALHRLRPLRDFDPRLMVAILWQWSARGLLANYTTQTSIAHLPRDRFLNIPIPRAPVPEQRAISSALSAIDALLDGLERLIAKKRDIKQAAMQQLLTGRTRLAGFDGAWEERSLGELGEWRGGMTPSMSNPAYWDDGDVPWISSGDVKCSHMHDTASHVTREAVTSRTTTVVPSGVLVLVTRSGILRRYLPVAVTMCAMAINQDIKALVPSRDFWPEFLLQLLTWSGPQILGTCMKSGTTVESVEFGWLKAFSVRVPEIREQHALASLDDEIDTLAMRVTKTRALKQAMMQELLTGRTRLV